MYIYIYHVESNSSAWLNNVEQTTDIFHMARHIPRSTNGWVKLGGLRLSLQLGLHGTSHHIILHYIKSYHTEINIHYIVSIFITLYHIILYFVIHIMWCFVYIYIYIAPWCPMKYSPSSQQNAQHPACCWAMRALRACAAARPVGISPDPVGLETRAIVIRLVP